MIQRAKLDDLKRYLIRNLEETSERLRAIGKKNITQCIGIFDLAGIERKKHLCLQCLNLLAEFGRVYENYYPQQNYRIYAINCKCNYKTIMTFLVIKIYMLFVRNLYSY